MCQTQQSEPGSARAPLCPHSLPCALSQSIHPYAVPPQFHSLAPALPLNSSPRLSTRRPKLLLFRTELLVSPPKRKKKGNANLPVVQTSWTPVFLSHLPPIIRQQILLSRFKTVFGLYPPLVTTSAATPMPATAFSCLGYCSCLCAGLCSFNLEAAEEPDPSCPNVSQSVALLCSKPSEGPSRAPNTRSSPPRTAPPPTLCVLASL